MSYRVLSCAIPRIKPGGVLVSPRLPSCVCICHRGYQSTILKDGGHFGTWSRRLRLQKLTNQIQPTASYSQLSTNHHQKDSYYKSKYLLGPNPALVYDFTNYNLMNQLIFRNISSSNLLFKDESNVEKSVKRLKEQSSDLKEDIEKEKNLVVKKSLWQRFVAELKHYYNGFRLLFIDVKISCRLLYLLLNGKTLTRRENKQLVRTVADLFRLVPFLVFLVVPFMEFLLPVAVKLFPNMLPSTFAEENKEQEKLKKQLKVKLEMAKFLQDTVHESALQGKKPSKLAEEFTSFVDNIRNKGIQTSTKDIVQFSKLFEDEITLDNLSRRQLQALCRVLNITPIGTDAMLRFQLSMRLRKLKADDKMIVKESIETLTMSELQSACRARGMRALGLSEARLKNQLQQWLDLHLNEKIPTSLLLLSRALYLPENLSTTEQLKATISSLPESTTSETIVKVAELSGVKIDNKVKLDLIQHEEEVIQKERQEKTKEEQELLQKIREEAEAVAAEKQMEANEILQDDALDIKPALKEALVDAIPELGDIASKEITSKDLEEIESALEDIAEQKRLDINNEELQDLKAEVSEYKEDLEDLKAIMVATGGVNEIQESKSAKRLAKKVDSMIKKMDGMTEKLYLEKEKFQEEIEVREVKMKRSSEIREDEELMEKYQKDINADKANIISINEMVLALKRLQKVPDETRLQQIVEVLDEDRDGNIDISLVLKVIEQLGRENVKIAPSQLSEVIELIKQEEEFHEQEKLQEKQEKEQKQQQEAQGQ
ncbi:mitochondrial proton/calcium exchanger protein [Patella vulgata]|uniref:mitochondrial proton/calcium exchanger protein n=1 Tax=Patella vulgata TaxID=6465 RepID=UPI00218046BC|nr:mitochondrial proton/calcium exchanger protein [Patella vulgata]